MGMNCAHCRYSQFGCSGETRRLWCLLRDEPADAPCEEWEREAGADDDKGEAK